MDTMKVRRENYWGSETIAKSSGTQPHDSGTPTQWSTSKKHTFMRFKGVFSRRWQKNMLKTWLKIDLGKKTWLKG